MRREQPHADTSHLSSGRTRYARLRLISCCSTVLAHEASRLAVLEAKKGRDIGRYQQAVQRLQTIAPDDLEARLDEEWIDHTTKAVTSATERMELELKGYKNNLIKESIRVCLISFHCFTPSSLTPRPHSPSVPLTDPLLRLTDQTLTMCLLIECQ